MSLQVEDFYGSHEAPSTASLEGILLKRDGAGYNSFWLSHINHKYPSLLLLVSNDLSSLHYFPRKSHPGFVPAGNIAGLKRGDTTIFRMDRRGEQVHILNDSIVPFAMSLLLAKEFFASESLPASVRWNEL